MSSEHHCLIRPGWALPLATEARVSLYLYKSLLTILSDQGAPRDKWKMLWLDTRPIIGGADIGQSEASMGSYWPMRRPGIMWRIKPKLSAHIRRHITKPWYLLSSSKSNPWFLPIYRLGHFTFYAQADGKMIRSLGITIKWGSLSFIETGKNTKCYLHPSSVKCRW